MSMHSWGAGRMEGHSRWRTACAKVHKGELVQGIQCGVRGQRARQERGEFPGSLTGPLSASVPTGLMVDRKQGPLDGCLLQGQYLVESEGMLFLPFRDSLPRVRKTLKSKWSWGASKNICVIN